MDNSVIWEGQFLANTNKSLHWVLYLLKIAQQYLLQGSGFLYCLRGGHMIFDKTLQVWFTMINCSIHCQTLWLLPSLICADPHWHGICYILCFHLILSSNEIKFNPNILDSVKLWKWKNQLELDTKWINLHCCSMSCSMWYHG